MTPTWFNTEERIAELVLEADSWIGTPFAPNSSSKGRGVSCQKLAGCLYSACGFNLPEVPDASIAQARFSRVSLVEPWFNGRAEFSRLDPATPILPGDVLGFRIGDIVHHLGVSIEPTRFIHAIEGVGTTLAHVEDATWRSRLVCIWRPKP